MNPVALHKALVEIPSVSHQETACADFLSGWLEDRGASVERLGDNVVARTGSGPLVLLNSHFDTVPPTEAWTRPPWTVQRDGDRIHGLGSNDAKASVVAMIAAFLDPPEGVSVGLLLAPEEETGGKGTEYAWPILAERGWSPAGVVVGEPTGLDIAVKQKGLLILELHAEGDACHSANAAALDARNPIAALARDLVALQSLDLGPPCSDLGATTLQPTVVRAGEARNQVPPGAMCVLDLRTVPQSTHAVLIERIRSTVESRLHVHSSRLEPVACPPGAAVVRAAQRARPVARVYGSRTMSDMVWFRGRPVIKVGPGQTERSHKPDEFVLESELHEGVRFYHDLLQAFATEVEP